MGLTTRQKITAWREALTHNTRVFIGCYLNFGGREYIFSTDQLNIKSTAKNMFLPVNPGLESELDLGESLDIGLREGQLQNASVSIWNKEKFQDLRTYVPLTKGQAEIFLWIEDLTWEQRLILLDGFVRSPSWGDPDDSFDFEILPKQTFVDRDFPPLQISAARFPNAPDSSLGDPYPYAYGDAIEIRCPYVNDVNFEYLITGHECFAAPTKIQLVNYNNISKQEVFSSECNIITDFDCQTEGAGTWAIAAGTLRFDHSANAVGYAWLIDTSGNHIKAYNQIIKTQCRFDSNEPTTAAVIGFFLRYINVYNYYYLYIERSNGGATTAVIRKIVGGADKIITSVSIPTIAMDTWFELSAKMDGNNITLYFNSEDVLSVEDASFPRSGDTCLWVQISTAIATSCSFDWVRFPVREPAYSLTTDGEGNVVYLADFADDLGKDTKVYADVKGRKNTSGAKIEIPAEVIENIAGLGTNLTADYIDSVAFGRAKNKLKNWKFSSVFQGSGSTKGTAFDTISQRLIKQLPLIPVWRENAYSIEYIDYDREDVSTYLMRGRNIIKLEGKIREGPIEDIANIFKVKYGYSPIEGRFLKYAERTPGNSGRCKLSRNKYGEREYQTIEAYDIQDDTTAGYLLDFLERTYSESPLLLTYRCTRELSYLEANRLICVTDPDQGWDDKKFLIEKIRYPGDSVILDLRSVS